MAGKVCSENDKHFYHPGREQSRHRQRYVACHTNSHNGPFSFILKLVNMFVLTEMTARHSSFVITLGHCLCLPVTAAVV